MIDEQLEDIANNATIFRSMSDEVAIALIGKATCSQIFLQTNGLFPVKALMLTPCSVNSLNSRL